MKKWLTVLGVLAIIAALVGIGAYGIFTDAETSEDNSLTAGTLDLKVDGQDDPAVAKMTFTDIKPGDVITHTWKLRNTGTIPGKVFIEIGTVTDNDEGCNEPEESAELDEWGFADCGDGEGELAEFLRTWVFQSHVNVESPIGWTLADYHANALTGCHPNGSPCGGLLYIEGDKMAGQTLGAGDFQMVKMKFQLDENVINDGAGWWTGHDVDDNLLQSDSISFDVIFHLEQAP